MDTAVIIAAHNRRDITLGCLKGLASDGVFEWAGIYLVDDGSTDGTSEAVGVSFPSVHLIRGGGDLWWTGATEVGMRAAIAAGAQFILWLNDDIRPLPGALAGLRRSAGQLAGVVSGQCVLEESNVVVYGGLRRHGFTLDLVKAAGGHFEPMDATAGSFVIFPAAVVGKIGYPDSQKFPHAFGDLDYTMRAKRAGFGIWTSADSLAYVVNNGWPNQSSWLLGDIAVSQIWRGLWQKKSYTYAPAHIRFLRRHFGVTGVFYWGWLLLKRIPISFLRLTVPKWFLRRIWGGRSAAWEHEQQLRSASGGADRGRP